MDSLQCLVIVLGDALSLPVHVSVSIGLGGICGRSPTRRGTDGDAAMHCLVDKCDIQ